ncbi:hypothetical protein L914_00434 [Phytophthora nicotianae]|uniref:Uncharacterized protein n=3 Tax=Phytophthora nicotianae TaxID=4792 RepID=V9G0F3_PHYNI|nr:hypothetical protein F443_00467 [Phytophthora nicotianae P1569]ETL50295.1 hypothetical protein L916_00441 [Phytophthora nicotianae]ETM56623.1 hypothetical protein L914_00434 [Phytophthora nicotianae]ETO85937.1 hypothetical protein F444_00464 [Phytophthora nicotianae P1976]
MTVAPATYLTTGQAVAEAPHIRYHAHSPRLLPDILKSSSKR